MTDDRVPPIKHSGLAIAEAFEAYQRLNALPDDATEAAQAAAWDELRAALDVLSARWWEYRAESS
jgi:hypothetical protein